MRRPEAMRTAPSDTRAHGRGQAVSHFQQQKDLAYVVNWDSISIENATHLPMPDPFETYESHVRALVE
jgi:hypothetical protein